MNEQDMIHKPEEDLMTDVGTGLLHQKEDCDFDFVLATANHFAGCLSANPTVEAKRNDFYANVLTPTGPDVRMPYV